MQGQTQKLARQRTFGNIRISMPMEFAICMLTIPKMKSWKKKLNSNLSALKLKAHQVKHQWNLKSVQGKKNSSNSNQFRRHGKSRPVSPMAFMTDNKIENFEI